MIEHADKNSKLGKLLNTAILYHFIFVLVLSVIFGVLFPDFIFPIILLGIIFFAGSTIIYLATKSNKAASENQSQTSSPANPEMTVENTMPYLKEGIGSTTSKDIADIILNITGFPAVAITDTENVLAFAGQECNQYAFGKKITIQAILKAISSGEIQIIRSRNNIACVENHCSCIFQSAVIVPLIYKRKVVGTLSLYHFEKAKITREVVGLASELSRLLCLQIESAELDHQTQLLTEAKLDALQAQINPHFLFNSLNAINMYILKNPEFAKELIRRLAAFLRSTLGNTERLITIGDELKTIEDYLIIEKARFGDKLRIVIDVEEKLKKVLIPVLSIQPLVNNAIIHGIMPKDEPGLIRITVRQVYDEIRVIVIDNGVGIAKEDIEKVYEKGVGTGLGVGIYNVNERLKLIYGSEYGLKISSTPGEGTRAWFRIPVELDKELDHKGADGK